MKEVKRDSEVLLTQEKGSVVCGRVHLQANVGGGGGGGGRGASAALLPSKVGRGSPRDAARAVKSAGRSRLPSDDDDGGAAGQVESPPRKVHAPSGIFTICFVLGTCPLPFRTESVHAFSHR